MSGPLYHGLQDTQQKVVILVRGEVMNAVCVCVCVYSVTKVALQVDLEVIAENDVCVGVLMQLSNEIL